MTLVQAGTPLRAPRVLVVEDEDNIATALEFLIIREGYGLSECSSVVALNVPGGDRPGSVGRPLSNARVTIASNGETSSQTGRKMPLKFQ